MSHLLNCRCALVPTPEVGIKAAAVQDRIDERIKTAAEIMIHELETRRLTVVLTPSNIPEIADKGGMIRRVESRNPFWYRELCAEYEVNRSRPRRRSKHDTLIRRSSVRKALERIRDGRRDGVYISRVLPYVLDYARGEFDSQWWKS